MCKDRAESNVETTLDGENVDLSLISTPENETKVDSQLMSTSCNETTAFNSPLKSTPDKNVHVSDSQLTPSIQVVRHSIDHTYSWLSLESQGCTTDLQSEQVDDDAESFPYSRDHTYSCLSKDT